MKHALLNGFWFSVVTKTLLHDKLGRTWHSSKFAPSITMVVN